jgi:hypothetical protein
MSSPPMQVGGFAQKDRGEATAPSLPKRKMSMPRIPKKPNGTQV